VTSGAGGEAARQRLRHQRRHATEPEEAERHLHDAHQERHGRGHRDLQVGVARVFVTMEDGAVVSEVCGLVRRRRVMKVCDGLEAIATVRQTILINSN
jgi:hypothetical protein